MSDKNPYIYLAIKHINIINNFITMSRKFSRY